MRKFLSIVLLVLALSCAAFGWCAYKAGHDPASNLWAWVKFYREGLRTPLFSGFLTVGSFLLTLKATILLRIKEIYEEPKYADDWRRYQAQRKRENPSAGLTDYYGPLRNLGNALLLNVLFAITSAILQVTLGFLNNPWTVGVCMGFASTTLLLLLFLWWQIASNLLRWFDVIERRKQDELKKQTPEGGE